MKKFYLEFGEYWKGYFARSALATIKNVSTKYQTLQFFTERKVVSNGMKVALKAAFEEKSFGVLTVSDF